MFLLKSVSKTCPKWFMASKREMPSKMGIVSNLNYLEGIVVSGRIDKMETLLGKVKEWKKRSVENCG